MSTELIPFFVLLGLVFLYPVLSAVAHFRLKALKTRLAEDRCPRCRAVFGPSVIGTIQEFRGFVDPAPAGPHLQIVCPHCHAVWEYSDGSYTESSAW